MKWKLIFFSAELILIKCPSWIHGWPHIFCGLWNTFKNWKFSGVWSESEKKFRFFLLFWFRHACLLARSSLLALLIFLEMRSEPHHQLEWNDSPFVAWKQCTHKVFRSFAFILLLILLIFARKWAACTKKIYKNSYWKNI